jgi:hypothetical protein
VQNVKYHGRSSDSTPSPARAGRKLARDRVVSSTFSCQIDFFVRRFEGGEGNRGTRNGWRTLSARPEFGQAVIPRVASAIIELPSRERGRASIAPPAIARARPGVRQCLSPFFFPSLLPPSLPALPPPARPPLPAATPPPSPSPSPAASAELQPHGVRARCV